MDEMKLESESQSFKNLKNVLKLKSYRTDKDSRQIIFF